MANKRYYENYAGMDSRRKMEHEDSMMIKEDPNATANLPQNVIMKPYSKEGFSSDVHLDDTIRGIDYQVKDDVKEFNKNIKDKKMPNKF